MCRLILLEKPENVALIRDYDPSLPEIEHYPDQIEQVLLNITRNALQALSATGGTITVRTRTAFQVTLQGERYRLAARIDIEDDTGYSVSHSRYVVLSDGEWARRRDWAWAVDCT